MIDRIKAAPAYRYVTIGSTPQQTARNLYGVALELDGKQPDFKESGTEALLRISVFLIYLWMALDHIEAQIMERLGLTGGAAGDASLADIEHLTGEEALDLFNINAALLDCERMRDDIRQVINDWGMKREAA